MGRYILGLSAFNHDASACLINEEGKIRFIEEERLNKQGSPTE